MTDDEKAIESLLDDDAAARHCGTPHCRFNLQDHVRQADRIVVVNSSFTLDRENAIQILAAQSNKSRSRLASIDTGAIAHEGQRPVPGFAETSSCKPSGSRAARRPRGIRLASEDRRPV